MKKSKSILKIAIIVMAALAGVSNNLTIIMADLMASFPEASLTAIQNIYSAMTLTTSIASLGSGFLTKFFRKKHLIIAGIIIMILGGMIPVINSTSLAMLYISAALTGIGAGAFGPIVMTIILENFHDQEQASVLGLYTGVATLGAAVIMILAGQLCTQFGWVSTYYMYALLIVSLLGAIFFLPMDAKPVRSSEDQAGGKTIIPVKGWIICAFMFLLMIGYAAWPLTATVFAAEYGICDADRAAVVLSLAELVTAGISLFFGKITGLTKTHLLTVASITGLVGMIVAASASNFVMLLIAGILLGVFFGLCGSAHGYYIGMVCTPEQYGPTISVAVSAVTLGIMLEPTIINAITGIWTKDAARGAFFTSTVILAFLVVITFIWGAYLKRNINTAEEKENNND